MVSALTSATEIPDSNTADLHFHLGYNYLAFFYLLRQIKVTMHRNAHTYTLYPYMGTDPKKPIQ